MSIVRFESSDPHYGAYNYTGENAKIQDLVCILWNILHEPESGADTIDGFITYYLHCKPDRLAQYFDAENPANTAIKRKKNPSARDNEILKEKLHARGYARIRARIKHELLCMKNDLITSINQKEPVDFMRIFYQNGCILIHEQIFGKLGIPDPFRGMESADIQASIANYNCRAPKTQETQNAYIVTDSENLIRNGLRIPVNNRVMNTLIADASKIKIPEEVNNRVDKLEPRPVHQEVSTSEPAEAELAYTG